jgi:tetratricopeptide (TPR) repeat protein
MTIQITTALVGFSIRLIDPTTMATSPKPPVTGAAHTLPFEKLSPLDFERLCLWLVEAEGYTNAEHLGEAGSEQGRDVVAWKDGRRVAFQCKRVQAFNTAHVQKEIEKLRKLTDKEQPHEIVFVVSRAVRAETRKAAREAWGDEASCHFWAGSELDKKVKGHPHLLREFFQLPPDWGRATFPHNLPFTSLGPLFQGRKEMLARLRKTLEQSPAGRATAIAGKVVHGLGGVGKTRLAVEYAWQHAADYSALLFVAASSPAELRRNLAALCERKILDLPEQQATEEKAREAAVLRWLQEHSGWLLILDNVDSEDAAAVVDDLIAGLHGGHVLLTGRLARWSAGIESIDLDVLAEEAAVGFLLARTKDRRRATKEDDAQALTLSRELGCLPLALEQAGAYIAERRLTLVTYIKEWQSRHDQVLSWFDPRVSHYPASVAVTWQTSFDRLTASARCLLERLAWLGPEPIPESLLDVPVPDLIEPDADALTALVQLETYSLVTRSAEAPTFTVHRLVQDVTRCSLKNAQREGPLNEALRWLHAASLGDPQDVRTWPVLDPLVPHTRAIITFARDLGITAPTAQLMNDLGVLFLNKALFSEAEPLIRGALEIDEKSLGAQHLNVGRDLNNLAQLLQATNHLDEVEPLMDRAINIFEECLGKDHPKVAAALGNLAQILQAKNLLEEAELLLRRALDIDERNFGIEDPTVARDLNNLAQLLQAKDHLIEAEPLLRRALAIDQKHFGKQHPNAAIRLNNLSLLLQATDRLDEAETMMRQALSINEKSFGKQHPNVAICLNNLARLLKATDRSRQAEPLMRRALAIDKKFFGKEHPKVAIRLNNLAQLLQDSDRIHQAEPLMRQALAIDEKSFGTMHPEVAIRLNNLAQLLQARKRFAEAEPLMRRHVAIFLDCSRRAGSAHKYLQAAYGNYTALLKEMGKSEVEIRSVLEELVRSAE